jgi:hypothetical protein
VNNIKITSQNVSRINTVTPSPLIIIDTGATGHYLQAQGGLTIVTPTTQGITVILPDGTTTTTTYKAILPIPPEMPPEMQKGATLAHIFPAIKHSLLLSIRQLCDHGCEAHFDANKVMIRHNGKTMLTRKRSHGTIGKL